MAAVPELNFPDPAVTQTYTEAGITWTWNADLKVWSVDDVSSDPDDRYLIKSPAVGTQTITSTSPTVFRGQVTLPGGGNNSQAVTRGEVQSMIEGIVGGPGVGDITEVIAGDGLTGGGSLGDVTVAVDESVLRSDDTISAELRQIGRAHV